MNRYLLAIPVIFAASITAAACSSSSTPATGTDSGVTNPNCAILEPCCASLGSQAASCAAAVASGGDTCTTDLTLLQSKGMCGGSTGPGSGTGTGTGSGTGMGTGTGTGTGTGIGTTGMDASMAGCTPQPVTGMTFTGKTLFPNTTCTTMDVDAVVTDCFGSSSADAAIAACDTAIGAADGGLNTCGSCVLSDPNGPSVGAFIQLVVPVAAGSQMGFPVDLFDEAGCVAAVDPSTTGQACATALEEQQSCEFAACAAVCPIASQTDTEGMDALLGTSAGGGCLADADTTVCTTQASASQTACASEMNSGMTGALDKCNALLTAANVATPTAASTTAFEQYVGLLCGGVDAGL